MIKMEMDEQRLREVIELSRIGLPEEEFKDVLDRVNAVLRMCDEMQDLRMDGVSPFEWDIIEAQRMRPDVPEVWEGRDDFLNQAPVRDGDFFRVPRIIPLEEDGVSEE